jgi:fluoroquinolone transport system permease protein
MSGVSAATGAVGLGVRRFATAVRLDLLVQRRYYFMPIYAALTILYVVAIRLTGLRAYVDWLVPLFIFSEPATLGFYLAAAQLFFERTEHALTALAVTPLRSTEYLAARTVSASLTGTVAGLVLFALTVGPEPRRLAMAAGPLALAAAAASLAGVAFASYFSEFLGFVFASVPMVIPLIVPMFSYFGVLPEWSTLWIPSHALLFVLRDVASGTGTPAAWALYSLELAVWVAIAWVWCSRAYRIHVRERLEAAT